MTGRRGQRFLLVGYGFRGRQWHEVCRRRRGVNLVAVVDPDPDARGRAASRGLRPFPDVREALGAVRPAGAIIASPPEAHVADAIACLEGGAGLLVEKPVALSVAEAIRFADAAEAAGRPAVVVQNFRLRPHERAVRRVLPEIGAPRRVVFTSARPSVDRTLLEDPLAPLWNMGVHHFDMVRTRFGAPPEVVRASVARGEGRSMEIVAEMAWPHGLLLSYRHREGSPWHYYHEWIEGTDAGIVAEETGVRLVRPRRYQRRVRARARPQPESALLARLLAGLDGASTRDVGPRENVETLAMVEAVERAIGSGGDVRVADLLAASEPRGPAGAG